MQEDVILQERLISRLEKFLDLNQRGFELTYLETQPNYVVAYNTSQCCIRCYLSIDKRDGEYVGISYGRKHAPNDDMYLEWQGEKQIAWHQFVIGYLGPFLDEFPFKDLAQIEKQQRYGYRSKAEELFESSGESEKLKEGEWILGFEGLVINFYGERLFNLLDKRCPKRWEEYRRYLQSLYNQLKKDPKEKEILDKLPEWMPYPWQVC